MTPTSDLMQALTWSLLHFLWQGAAITDPNRGAPEAGKGVGGYNTP